MHLRRLCELEGEVMETNLNKAINTAINTGKELNLADLLGGPNKITVENMWRVFSHLLYQGKEISAVQYQETKQAYFIGFSECFKIMTDISEKFDEDEASKILTRLARESNEYIESALKRQTKQGE